VSFTKFTTLVHFGTEVILRSKVKFTTGPNVVKDLIFEPFCHCRRLIDYSLNLVGCVMDGFAVLHKRLKVKILSKGGSVHVDNFLLNSVYFHLMNCMCVCLCAEAKFKALEKR